MRRLFWCGAGLSVALAAYANLLAWHVERNPDTFLAKYVIVAYKVGIDYNPIARLGSPLEDTTRTYTQSIPSYPQRLAAKMPRSSPEVCRENQEPLNLIQISPFTASEQEQEVVEQAGYVDPCVSASSSIDVQVAGVVTPGDVEESEGLPAIMPRCDEDKSSAAPDTMPYCDDDEPLFELWKNLFENDDSKKEPPAVMDKDEESETLDGRLQEDPHYHHQYPGCPHSGSTCCPYTGRCYPDRPQSEMKPTVPPIVAKKKKKKDSSSQKRTSRKISIPEATPTHPDIDTMEFRKSDAPKNDHTRAPR